MSCRCESEDTCFGSLVVGEEHNVDLLEKTGSLNVHDSIHRRCSKTNGPLLGLIAVPLIR